MKISVSGKHMDVGHAIQEYIEEKIHKTANKYLSNVNWVEIILSKEHGLFNAEIVMHESRFGTIKASFENDEVYAAFDIALVKLEKQIRKYKDRIITKERKHSKEIGALNSVQGTKYVLSSEDYETPDSDSPVTIAEKATDIQYLTVSEAIMHMDLSSVPALLFFNKANGRLNVVYHRKDGNIAWVDPGVVN
jgi:ribosomal subunit interface protein